LYKLINKLRERERERERDEKDRFLERKIGRNFVSVSLNALIIER